MSRDFDYKQVKPQGKILNSEKRRNIPMEIGMRMARISEVIYKEPNKTPLTPSDKQKEQAVEFLLNEVIAHHNVPDKNGKLPEINNDEKRALDLVFREYTDVLFSTGYTAKEGFNIYKNVEKNDIANAKQKIVPIAILKNAITR